MIPLAIFIIMVVAGGFMLYRHLRAITGRLAILEARPVYSQAVATVNESSEPVASPGGETKSTNTITGAILSSMPAEGSVSKETILDYITKNYNYKRVQVRTSLESLLHRGKIEAIDGEDGNRYYQLKAQAEQDTKPE